MLDFNLTIEMTQITKSSKHQETTIDISLLFYVVFCDVNINKEPYKI